jgi:hypothetical protein
MWLNIFVNVHLLAYRVSVKKNIFTLVHLQLQFGFLSGIPSLKRFTKQTFPLKILYTDDKFEIISNSRVEVFFC